MISLRKSVTVTAIVILTVCCFEQDVSAQPRNEAVLNWPFTTTGPMANRGSWVWRDKKNQAPGLGIEGFVAYVEPIGTTGNANIKIRLYEGPSTSGGQLVLSETYGFVLQPSNEANSRSSSSKKNRTFSFVLRSPVNNAGGNPVNNGKDRLFFLTGTGLKDNSGNRNPNRTFRMTTIVIDSRSGIKGDKEDQDYVEPCSDYPDDAVLEEELYSQSVPYPPSPDPTDPWLTYTWP